VVGEEAPPDVPLPRAGADDLIGMRDRGSV
jgi:hypothetical protein